MKKEDCLSRKEITALVPMVSEDQIRRNEKEWGLDKFKITTKRRPVLYRKSVLDVFRKMELL